MMTIVVTSPDEESFPALLAALRGQTPDLPRIFVLGPTRGGLEEKLSTAGEVWVRHAAGPEAGRGRPRELGLERAEPKDDILFLDGDWAPEGLSREILRKGLERFDLCLLQGEAEARRSWFGEDFGPNPAFGFELNGVLGMGLAVRREAIEAMRHFQGGCLFHPAFDGVAEYEDLYLGDVAYHLGLSCGCYPLQARLRRSFPVAPPGNPRVTEQIMLRRRLRLMLRVRDESPG